VNEAVRLLENPERDVAAIADKRTWHIHRVLDREDRRDSGRTSRRRSPEDDVARASLVNSLVNEPTWFTQALLGLGSAVVGLGDREERILERRPRDLEAAQRDAGRERLAVELGGVARRPSHRSHRRRRARACRRPARSARAAQIVTFSAAQ